jgi:hypothetical protein
LGAGVSPLPAQPIPVPNGSFESPVPPAGFPVNTRIDSWQESPQPAWFNPADFGGVTWDQLTGVFPNPPPESSANHIDNLDGAQAAYLFAVPEVALFQDYDTVDWDDAAPSHAFNSTFEVGMAYRLTVGVIGGSGMAEGAGLRLSLYYRDPASNPVTVGATDIFYSTAAFPTITHLNDYQVDIPPVQASDAWAGKTLGVQIAAISPGGTYWDIENVRVSAIPEPGSVALVGLGLGVLLLARARSGGRSRA